MRSRWSAARRIGLALAVLVPVLGAPGPVSAQSLFEQLFGTAKSPTPPPSTGTRPAGGLLTPGGRAYDMNRGPMSQPVARSNRNDDDADARSDSGGKFRTVCVRLCDGFYFPVSFSTTRKSFYIDGARCRATCGEEGRLFYHPTPPNADIAQAVDLSGRTYERLANAFKYRKTLVEGCGCRPAPWSDGELGRHRRYADDAARKGGAPVAPTEAAVAAGAPPEVKAPAPDAAAETRDVAAQNPSATAAKPAVEAGRRRPTETPARVALRQAPAPRRDATQRTTPQSSGFGGAMGLGGGPKLRWPGD